MWFSNKLHTWFIFSLLMVFSSVLMLILIGCEQPPPPPPPSRAVETEPQKPQEETKEEETVEIKAPEYQYDPSGRREPFKTLIAEEIPEIPDVIATPNPELLKTPLQKFDINQLKLTGIILGGLGDYARVSAPDGKSYTINIGTLMGKHEGQVMSIDDNVVIVKEILRYESGKVEEIETPLYLNPIDKEGQS